MRNKIAKSDVEAILIIYAYMARHGIFTRPAQPTSEDAANVLELYEEFLDSSYNLPYRPLRVCLEAFLEFFYESGRTFSRKNKNAD